jgi:hypothetical protein
VSGMDISYRVQVPNTLYSREYQPIAKVSRATANLKEAGGKRLSQRTEIA